MRNRKRAFRGSFFCAGSDRAERNGTICVPWSTFNQSGTIMERMTYVRPAVELLDVAVERGFAGTASTEAKIEGFNREEWNE